MPPSHAHYEVRYCDNPRHPDRPHRHRRRFHQNRMSPPVQLEMLVRDLAAPSRRIFNGAQHCLRTSRSALVTRIQLYCWKSGLPPKDLASLTLALILLMAMAVFFSPPGTTILTSDTLALQAGTFAPELGATLREVFDSGRETQIKFLTRDLIGGKPTYYFWLPDEGLGLVWSDGAAGWIHCLDLDDLVRHWEGRTDEPESGFQRR